MTRDHANAKNRADSGATPRRPSRTAAMNPPREVPHNRRERIAAPMTLRLVAPVSPTNEAKLAKLAISIRASIQTSAAAAIEVGRKLIEAKALLPHGQWLPWLKDHVGISERTAQDYMALARDPNPQRAAGLSIRSALEQARSKTDHGQRPRGPSIMLRTHLGEQVAYPRPTAPAVFNQTNEHISWAAFSWNPVTGCLHGCPYCYARAIALSPTTAAHFPAGFTPLYHPEQ